MNEKPKREKPPQTFDKVLKRMLSSPPKPHKEKAESEKKKPA